MTYFQKKEALRKLNDAFLKAGIYESWIAIMYLYRCGCVEPKTVKVKNAQDETMYAVGCGNVFVAVVEGELYLCLDDWLADIDIWFDDGEPDLEILQMRVKVYWSQLKDAMEAQ